MYRPHPSQGRGIENCVGIPYSCAPRRSYLDAFQSVPEHTVLTLVFLSLQLCILCKISVGEIVVSFFFFFNVIAEPDLKSRGLENRSVWRRARPWVQSSAVKQKNQKLPQNVLVSYAPSSSKYVIQVLVGDYAKEV